MRRRSRTVDSSGSYSISGPGVNASSVTLGAAVSKAITLATRMQKGMSALDTVRSIYVRKLGQEAAARIDVYDNVIETYVFVPTK